MNPPLIPTAPPPAEAARERPLFASGDALHRVSHALPEHLATWQLPPGWHWGSEGVWEDRRHFQELIDALGRSLSLVSAPLAEHASWLEAEARALAHRNHPAVPTTYHYWSSNQESRRGPGYLRRWIAGEAIGARLARAGAEDVSVALRVMREVGSTLTYLHDAGSVHGALSVNNVLTSPMGRLWLIGWQWAVPLGSIPDSLAPDATNMPRGSRPRHAHWRTAIIRLCRRRITTGRRIRRVAAGQATFVAGSPARQLARGSRAPAPRTCPSRCA